MFPLQLERVHVLFEVSSLRAAVVQAEKYLTTSGCGAPRPKLKILLHKHAKDVYTQAEKTRYERVDTKQKLGHPVC